MEGIPETDPDEEGFRRGDEPEDTMIGEFKVYAGDPELRDLLARGEPLATEAVEHYLHEALEGYLREMHL